MSRELETFRDNMEWLNAQQPEKNIFNVSEVTRLLGVNRATVVRMLEFDRNYISKVNLARGLAKMGGAR